ncbi:MAG: hypothetical protein ACOCRX_11990 [Candidatus Woesearchaeota archaeon]
MSKIKSCKNCGAENDLLFTNCQFCKSPHPEVDLKSISNEDLVTNAAEWVGRVGTSYTVTSENANTWTGKGIRTYEAPENEGYAMKYLTLLQVRAATNPSLNGVYNSLKKDFDEKKNSLLGKFGGGDKKKGIAFISVFAILILFMIFLLLN